MEYVESFLLKNGVKSSVEVADYLGVKLSVVKKELSDHKYLCASKIVVDKFFAEYKGVKEWIKYKQEKALKDGYVDSWYGFRIWLPEYGYPYYEGREKEYANYRNVAVNGSIIGTEANIMQDMMLQIDDLFVKNNYNAHIINQVHDDVWLEIDENLIDELREPVKAIMTEPREIYNGIPVDAEGEYGKVVGGCDEHPWQLWFK
jgi:DNA polymerase I-like protein with 3'-5' exonuclease and polymerase domains